jgi:hypothetical protein
MDEMKLKLSTKLMRGIVAKLISKALFKKLGCRADIELNEIEVLTKDDKIFIHVNADGEISKEDFAKLIKGIDPD